MRWMQEGVAVLADLVYPKVCSACGGRVGREGSHLCWDCRAALPFIRPPYCECCGDPVEGDVTGLFRCAACVERTPAFERARSAVRYRGPIREALQRFKYGRETHLSRDFADLLGACVRTHYAAEPFDAVAFVPLHRRKRRERTYNQAELLAEDLSRLLRLPLATRCIERRRATSTQTALSARARRQNVRGAFVVTAVEWVRGRRFLLVDDVMTTGATVDECARAMKEAGAATVCVVTVARG